MTVVAFRSGIMACDTCWSDGEMQTVSATKITRLSSGALLGQAGANDARAVVALLDKVKKAEQLPSREALVATRCEFAGILALPRGGAWIISISACDEGGWDRDDEETGVWPATTMGGYAAVGAGGEHALCLMDAGLSAERACRVVANRVMSCRPPIITVSLHGPRKRRKRKIR